MGDTPNLEQLGFTHVAQHKAAGDPAAMSSRLSASELQALESLRVGSSSWLHHHC